LTRESLFPSTLLYAEKDVEFDAKIDTGSTFCVFQRLHGELLGLDIESGIDISIGTATGSFRAFGHEVTLNVFGIETVSTVYFAENDYFDRNVLGRTGWLNRVKLGLIDQEGKLFLSEYR
jgi:predicted aspartyl protease